MNTTIDELLKTAAIEGGGREWTERKITADEFWDRMRDSFCTRYGMVSEADKAKAAEKWDSDEIQRKVYKIICNIKSLFGKRVEQ